MASSSPGLTAVTKHAVNSNRHEGEDHMTHNLLPLSPSEVCQLLTERSRSSESGWGDSGYGSSVNNSDGASTCSSSNTDHLDVDNLASGNGASHILANSNAGVAEDSSGSGGTLLVLEPKSLRSFTTNDEYLYAMTEDLGEWFTCLYKMEVNADNFFNVLETGVLLCQHANKVQDFARQRRETGSALEMKSYFIRTVPAGSVPFRAGVKPGTFQARDNVSNFISWGRQLGIPEVLSFETDDLVMRKNEKSVILCLLEIARVGAKLGMLAPTLVQMEQEIDAELAGEEPEPKAQIKTCDMRSLDEMVRDLVGRCTCPVQFPMTKVGEGKYKIGDSQSLIFVRILRKHVMVRVGGGWDTLENYLNKHDPCQCNYRGHRPTVSHTSSVNKVNQQRRASTPGNSNMSRAPAMGTPTSPRRNLGAAQSVRQRSASPQFSVTKNNNRSKSPTVIISKHLPEVAKSSSDTNNSSSVAETNLNGRGTPVSQSWSNSSQFSTSSSLQQALRSKSPSPVRSPSPLTVYSNSNRKGCPSPSVSRKVAHSSFNRTVSLDQLTESSAELDEEKDEKLFRSSVCHDNQNDRSREETNLSGKANVTMDKISTMTLSEFKSLLNSSMTLPTNESSSPRSNSGVHGITSSASTPGASEANKDLTWDGLREKARSVRDSLSSSVDNRRASSTQRQNISQSSNIEPPRLSASRDRPKTPQASRRSINSANVISRPKTPTSFMSRPKTPTSIGQSKAQSTVSNQKTLSFSVSRPKTAMGIGRPKTPVGTSHESRAKTPTFDKSVRKEEYKMARSKTPSQIKREAVAKVAGAISNWVESRQEFISQSNASTKSSRPKTPVSQPRTPNESFVPGHDLENFDNEEIASALSQHQLSNITSTVRERPQTPSRIPKPNFTPRAGTPKLTTSRSIDISTPSELMFLNQRSDDENTKVDETLQSNSSNVQANRTYSITKKPTNLPLSSAVEKEKTYQDIFTQRRAMTPGPRISDSDNKEFYNDSKLPRQEKIINSPRRSSVAGIQRGVKQTTHKTRSQSCSNSRRNSASYENNQEPIFALTNEITFSDDEEINEILIQNAKKQNTEYQNRKIVDQQPITKTRGRSASVDAHKLALQKSGRKEEILIVSRNSDGQHGVCVMNKDNVKYDSTQKVNNVMRRPSSRSASASRNVVKADPKQTKTLNRFRSRTPDPSIHSQTNPQDKEKHITLNRTEAWVDSTLSDPKTKLPPRPRRTKTINSEVSATELLPRPLHEIQAALSQFENGADHISSKSLEAPPEDSEKFKKMEKLFEKYREKEVRASVNDIPSAVGSFDNSNTASSRDPSYNSSNHSTASGHSNVNSVDSFNSYKDKLSNSESNTHPSSYANFVRASSLPPTLQTDSNRDYRAFCDSNDPFLNSNNNIHNSTKSNNHRSDSNSLKDIDTETAQNPAALISKIKEILQVRPRKDDTGIPNPTRIPGPAILSSRTRSKSVSNIFSGLNSELSSPYSKEETIKRVKPILNQTTSLPSGNSNEKTDDMKLHFSHNQNTNNLNSDNTLDSNKSRDLSRTWSVQSDSTDRSETPAPKLTNPLTTGRSTFIYKRSDH